MASPVFARLICALACLVAMTACSSPERSELVQAGRAIYTRAGCATCHGGRGEGGVGPSLRSVPTTFPACADQLAWVRLGSERWRAQRGERYGDTDKPVRGGMLSFEDALSERERKMVVAYERIELGGLDEAAVRTDCGL